MVKVIEKSEERETYFSTDKRESSKGGPFLRVPSIHRDPVRTQERTSYSWWKNYMFNGCRVRVSFPTALCVNIRREQVYHVKLENTSFEGIKLLTKRGSGFQGRGCQLAYLRARAASAPTTPASGERAVSLLMQGRGHYFAENVSQL